jgi:hypothetical protein
MMADQVGVSVLACPICPTIDASSAPVRVAGPAAVRAADPALDRAGAGHFRNFVIPDLACAVFGPALAAG